jgi:TolB protein
MRDGTRLAYETLAGKTYEIYARTLSTGETVQLTTNQANDWAPSWSPGGDRIVYVSERNKNVGLYVVELATLAETRLTETRRRN